ASDAARSAATRRGNARAIFMACLLQRTAPQMKGTRLDMRYSKVQARFMRMRLLLALCFVAACTRSSAHDPVRPVEILVATDPETLDPRYATDAVSLRTTRLIHAGLTGCDPDTLEPAPAAAKSWAWLDARTLRVELRDDVSFHSGKKLGASDVVATFQAVASK